MGNTVISSRVSIQKTLQRFSFTMPYAIESFLQIPLLVFFIISFLLCKPGR